MTLSVWGKLSHVSLDLMNVNVHKGIVDSKAIVQVGCAMEKLDPESRHSNYPPSPAIN